MNSSDLPSAPEHRKAMLPADITAEYIVNGEPETVLFLGVGQSGNNLKAISAHMPRNSATVEAFRYHRMILGDIGTGGREGVLYMLQSFGKGPYHVIAESQAAPAVVHAAHEKPDLFKSITLLEPLGFNADSFGDTPEERYTTFLKRSRQFWAHPNQSLSIKANRDTMGQIFIRSLPALRRLKPDYGFGVSQDITEMTKALAKIVPLTIYAEEYDNFFPYREIAPKLTGSKVTLIKTTAGSHLNRASPKGIAELEKVIASLRGPAR